MDQLRTAAVALLGLTVLALAGCTFANDDGENSTAPRPTSPSSAPPSPSSSPGQLIATYPDFEALYGTLDSRRGTAELGPYSKISDRIGVYVRCYGEGVITIDIPGAAKFEQLCLLDANDPGTRNTIDVTYVDEIVVRGSAENSNLWSIAVTEAGEVTQK